MGAHDIDGVLALAIDLDDLGDIGGGLDWRSGGETGAMGWFGGDGKRPSN